MEPARRRNAQRALAAVGGLVVALLLAEGILRVTPVVSDKSLIPYVAVDGDEGQAPRPDRAVRTLKGVLERTNAQGLRDPFRDLERPRDPALRRIVLLGDSVAWGYGLQEEDTIGRRLERRLEEKDARRTWEVWTLAQPATTVVNHAARYERLGPQIEPDLVLVMVVFNDLLPGATRFRVTGSGMLASPHRSAPYPDALRPLLDRSAVFHLAMTAIYASEKRRAPDEHAFDLQHLPDLLGGLERIDAAAKEHDARALLVLVPGRYEDPEDYVTLRNALAGWGRTKGAPLIDLAETLGSPLREEYALPGDSTHPDADAADLIAQVLATEVADWLLRR